jgi:asparagine synthase (glutamine-hydrolysing)
VLAHPLLQDAVPDVEATALLVAGRSAAERTAHAGISALPGGHVVRWQAGHPVEAHRWWKPRERGDIRYRDPRDYLEHAKSVFTAATDGRLRAAGGISASVSGGLDSALVAGVAATELRRSDRTLAMYTSVPADGIPCFERPGWDRDETGLVRQLASFHGNTTHTLVRPDGTSPLLVMQETHAVSRTPVRNTANQVWFRAICRMASAQGSRVLLTGERGNATVSLGAEASLGRLFSTHPFRAMSLARQDARNGGRPALRSLFGELRVRARMLTGPPQVPWYGESLLSEAMQSRLAPALTVVEDLRHVAAQEAFATGTVRPWSRDELAHSGVEFRDPTSDKRLIELLLAFPPEAFFAEGYPRGLARAMGKGLMPDSIRLRRNRGMQVPEHCGIIAADGEPYRDALRSLHDSPACRTHLRLDRAERDLERLRAGQLDLRAAITMDRLMDVGLFWKARGI